MSRDTNYVNTKYYFEQGGEAGYFDSDFSFYFNEAQVTGDQLKQLISNKVQTTTIGQGATSTVLSIVNLPAGYGTVILSMTSTMVTGSFWLTSDPVVGQGVLLLVRSGSTASGAIVFSASGCSIVGLQGTDISGFTLYNSAASAAAIQLYCHTAGEWAVVGIRNQGCYAE